MTRRLFFLLSLLSFLSQSVLAIVLAIDYGSDFMKASLMKPGVPFDVLLNKDSKRKIQSSVAWKRDDRLFGGDAFNLAGRFPKDSFTGVKHLQGVPFDSDATAFYTTISTAEVMETARGTVGLKASDGTEWSTEELIAMQLSYVKGLAESLAGEKVNDVVITVPPFYTQIERDAVADAVEISGLRLLTLINDGAAIAVNYAMSRTFDTPEYHVIYDAGAASVRASVVSFASTPETKKAKASTVINVAGSGYDRTIGANALDRRLRDILLDHFKAKHHKDIRGDARAMAKLWKETVRVKAILSANNQAMSAVESLTGETDFKTKVTRSEFEAASADLTALWAAPILDAISNAGLTLDNITSVIFHGGATRIPMVQAAVKRAVGEDKIANNVNTDEAAVLGAALYGAGLSGRFKTKNFKLSDVTLYDVRGTYYTAASSPLSRPRTISNVIFPAGAKVGTKKTLTFKRKEDFSLFLDYARPPVRGFPERILEAEFLGIAEAIANLTERGAIDPVVKATVMLSESGLVSVRNAHAYGEIKDESLTGKLKGFFGAGSSSSEYEESTSEAAAQSTDGESSSASPTPSAASSASETPSSSSSSSSAKASATADQSVIALKINMKWPPKLAPMDSDEKKAAYRRLMKIDKQEQAKARREDVRNGFESYLYRMRDLLDPENKDTPFKRCSSVAERGEMERSMEELFDWLNDQGDDADVPQFLEKRSVLETLEKPVIHRYEEIAEFPKALNQSQMWNWSTRLFLTEAKANLTREEAEDTPSKWTRAELQDLEKVLIDHEKWLNEWVEKQKSVKMYENPVIETTEMKARAKVLETHLARLARRKVPKKIKPKSTSAAAPEETNVPPAEESQKEKAEDASRTEVPVEETPKASAPPEHSRDEL